MLRIRVERLDEQQLEHRLAGATLVADPTAAEIVDGQCAILNFLTNPAIGSSSAYADDHDLRLAYETLSQYDIRHKAFD